MLKFIRFLTKKGTGNFWRVLKYIEKRVGKRDSIEFESLRRQKPLDQCPSSADRAKLA